MMISRRVTTPTGKIVHLAPDVSYPYAAAGDYSPAGVTLCGHPVGHVMFTEGYEGIEADHRPVECRQCVSRVTWIIKRLNALLEGEPEGWEE